MNVPLLRQVITEMERCQAFNLSGSWTRWIGMLQQAGEGAQTVSKIWVLVDADGIIRGGSAGCSEKSRQFLEPAPAGSEIRLVHGPVTLGAHINTPMVYPPLAASSARAGSERQEIACRHCGDDIRFIDGAWIDCETNGTCDDGTHRKHEPGQPQADDPNLVNAITAIVREADQVYMKVGGSSRHWVSECFLPLLASHGYRLASVPAVAAPSVGAAPQPDAETLSKDWDRWFGDAYAFADGDRTPENDRAQFKEQVRQITLAEIAIALRSAAVGAATETRTDAQRGLDTIPCRCCAWPMPYEVVNSNLICPCCGYGVEDQCSADVHRANWNGQWWDEDTPKPLILQPAVGAAGRAQEDDGTRKLIAAVEALQTYGIDLQGAEFGGLVERTKVLELLRGAALDAPEQP